MSNLAYVKRTAVIKQFCRLSSKVAEHFQWSEAADCFCKETKGPVIDEKDYRFSPKVMRFIKQAVEEKLKKSRK